MIDGLKLTFSGEEIRKVLEMRVGEHQRGAEEWEREAKRTPEEQTEAEPLLPEHMCSTESERDAWRADILQFIRDHVEPAETYRLGEADLEFAELMPPAPGWLNQEEYEERNRTGFWLERLTRAVERLAGTVEALLCKREGDLLDAPGVLKGTDGHTVTRLDGDCPEIVMVERK
jgi:hypothetical protein